MPYFPKVMNTWIGFKRYSLCQNCSYELQNGYKVWIQALSLAKINLFEDV